MKIHEFSIKSPNPPLRKGGEIILALGAESEGNFSVFVGCQDSQKLPSFPRRRESRKDISQNLWIPAFAGMTNYKTSEQSNIFFSDNFGDLLDDNNFKKFQKAVLNFLKKNKIKPNIILTDLHPFYKTTLWGAELAKKYNAKHIQVQHHLAHIFSAVGENLKGVKPPIGGLTPFVGIALDGTGYGLDGKIWGGEVFHLKFKNYELKINRIGHLENQIMIGGDLAVKEPARMLISVLNKLFNSYPSSLRPRTRCGGSNFGLRAQTARLPRSSEADSLAMTDKKNFIYSFVKKFYTKNQFELLYNQLQNNFNCVETSSTGRVLDAVSLLLGFCKNERNYKHEPIDLLEKNSTTPYDNLKPKIVKIYNKELKIMNYELCTTYLFEYLIKNINKDKRRLAATAQLYIAESLYKIIKKNHNSKFIIHNSYFAGGISNNKIISNYFSAKGGSAFGGELKGFIANKKVPHGDAGLSFGQLIFNFFNN